MLKKLVLLMLGLAISLSACGSSQVDRMRALTQYPPAAGLHPQYPVCAVVCRRRKRIFQGCGHRDRVRLFVRDRWREVGGRG